MTTLLVTADPSIGNPVADALESTGDDVMWCRGPAGVDCVCAAIRGTRCALTSGVDAVIVDAWLTSDQHDRGLRSSRLVEYYEGMGLPVVLLIGFRDLAESMRLGPRTIALPRRTDATEIAAAARGVAALSAADMLDRPA